MTIETEGARGRINRLEDPALLRGKGRFIDDIERSEMLEAAFVRSPFGHAEIRGIDTTAARELTGVHAVLTRDEIRPYLRNEYLVVGLPSKLYKQNRNWPALAESEVVHGEAVAIVVAENRYIAEDAAALVKSTTILCRPSPTAEPPWRRMRRRFTGMDPTTSF